MFGVEQKDDMGGARVSWPGEVLELPVLTARDIANTDIRIEVRGTPPSCALVDYGGAALIEGLHAVPDLGVE